MAKNFNELRLCQSFEGARVETLVEFKSLFTVVARLDKDKFH